MDTNDKVMIKGASLDANNGIFQITKTSDNAYTYTMGSAPGSNPTGTITSTFVVISGTTNGTTGQITTSRVYSSDQNFTGWARKGSSAPYYKTAYVSGYVDSSTGATITALKLLRDT